MKQLIFALLLLPVFCSAQNTRSINMTCPGCSVTGTYTASPTSFTGLTSTAGTAGSNSTLAISGASIANTTTVAVPSGYEIGLVATGPFASSQTVAANSGGLTGQPVAFYFHLLAANSAGNYNGNISISSPGATTLTVAVTGTTASATTPTLTTSKSTMSGFTATAGSASGSQGYGLSGVSLTTTGSVSASTCCQISLDNTTWNTTLTVPYNGAGGLTGQPVTIWGRISPSYTTVGTFNQNITNSSTGATNVLVAIQGTVTSVGNNDTVDVQLWDSVHASGTKYTATGVNNWAPIATQGLTSKFLVYRTTTQSPLQTILSVVNDYHDNASGWGNGNTMGYPAGALNDGMYNTAASTLIVHGFTGLSYTGIRIEIVSTVDVGPGGTAHYPSTFTVGSVTSTVNSDLNTSTVAVLDGLTPDGSGNITISNTFSNQFNVISYVRIIIKH